MTLFVEVKSTNLSWKCLSATNTKCNGTEVDGLPVHQRRIGEWQSLRRKQVETREETKTIKKLDSTVLRYIEGKEGTVYVSFVYIHQFCYIYTMLSPNGRVATENV